MPHKYEVVPQGTGWGVKYRGEFLYNTPTTREEAIRMASVFQESFPPEKTYFERTKLGTLISLFKKNNITPVIRLFNRQRLDRSMGE